MNESAKPGATAAETPHAGGKFLTFELAGEHYGVEILKVSEIIGWTAVTDVPRTPPYVRGVANIRGRVIPVIDTRVKFELDPSEATDETCIVIIGLAHTEIGMIVDRVLEVIQIPATRIDPAPAFGPDVRTEYILGIAKSDRSVTILLDVDHVLTPSELSVAEAAAADPPKNR